MVATTSTVASIPGQTMGVGVFTDYLIVALDLSRVQLSAAYMVGTIASSVILPTAGRVLDITGSRVMVVIASVGLGLSLIVLAGIEHILRLLQVRSLLFAMTVSILSFMLIRFFGQGCLTMVSRVAIGKWFNHKRGLATAISGVFVTFGFGSAPLILNRMVQSLGWREACVALAVIVGLGMSIVGGIFYRDNPEDCGLVMDGVDDPDWLRRMSEKIPDVHWEFTRSQALRTFAFWVFGLALGTQSLVVTAVTFHLASLGSDAGLSRSGAYELFLPMSIFGVAANLIGGWVSDTIKLKWLLVFMMAFQATGTCGLLGLEHSHGQWLFIGGYGISGGLFSTLITVTWPRFFGRMHLGAISGITMSLLVFASAIGPLLFSLNRWITGNYILVTLICWFVPLCFIFVGVKAENPQESLSKYY